MNSVFSKFLDRLAERFTAILASVVSFRESKVCEQKLRLNSKVSLKISLASMKPMASPPSLRHFANVPCVSRPVTSLATERM